MKKVLAFVLVLSMILGSFGMAFASNAQADALSVLSGLGVFAGYTDGSMGEDKVVTRAEAATLIIKAMDLQDYAVGKADFTDMAEAKWAEPFVAYAVSLGFVKGNTDGTFAPNAPVTSDQMITMLVQAIGYKAEYLTGGYPGAFVNTAKALGILEGVKSGTAGCTRGDVAQMIYNALDVPFVSYDAEGGLQYTVLRGTADDEVVYDNFMARLIAELDKETKVIEGDEESKINLKPYQGAYATLIKDGDDVVAVDDIKSVFVTGEYDEEEGVFVVDEKEYKLTKLEEEEDYESTEAAYFENGDAAGTVDLTETTGEVVVAVEISGNYITKLYSIADWNVDDEFMMTEDDVEALAEDSVLAGYEFAMNVEDEIDMDTVILAGVASLDKIAEDDVVTVYLDSEDKVVKVEVSNVVVEGKIAKVTKEDEMVIGGKAYEVGTLLEGSDAVELTAEGKFFLNFAGEIVYAEASSTAAEDYAVITWDADFDNEEVYGSDAEIIVKVKMMTADGKEAIYVIEEEYAEELGVTAEELGTTVAALDKNVVVAYHLNKDGEIDAIDAKTVVPADSAKMTAKGFIAGNKVAADAVVFVYDADEDEYTVADLKAVPAGEELVYSGYVLNEDEIEVIVLDTRDNEDEESVYAVLADWATGLDADDEAVYELVLLVDGAKKEFVSTTEFTLPETVAALYEVEFDGENVAEFKDVTAVETTTTTVAAIKDGNIKMMEEAGYREVASDVVVYAMDEEGNIAKAKFADIEAEESEVVLYELDGAEDDKDGIDVIIIL